MPAAANLLTRLRKICLALPAAEELVSHGAPWFRVQKGRTFCAFADNHHDDGRVAAWVKAAPGTQEMLIESTPDRFFRPPYVGPSGWVGVILDAKTDWAMLAELLADGWRQIAPKKLLTEASAPSPPARTSSRETPKRKAARR